MAMWGVVGYWGCLGVVWHGSLTILYEWFCGCFVVCWGCLVVAWREQSHHIKMIMIAKVVMTMMAMPTVYGGDGEEWM